MSWSWKAREKIGENPSLSFLWILFVPRLSPLGFKEKSQFAAAAAVAVTTIAASAAFAAFTAVATVGARSGTRTEIIDSEIRSFLRINPLYSDKLPMFERKRIY